MKKLLVLLCLSQLTVNCVTPESDPPLMGPTEDTVVETQPEAPKTDEADPRIFGIWEMITSDGTDVNAGPSIRTSLRITKGKFYLTTEDRMLGKVACRSQVITTRFRITSDRIYFEEPLEKIVKLSDGKTCRAHISVGEIPYAIPADNDLAYGDGKFTRVQSKVQSPIN